jgi:hypothetical protein
VSLPRYAHCSLYVTCAYIRALCIWVRMRMSIPLWVIGLHYGLYYTGLLKIRIIMSPTTFNQSLRGDPTCRNHVGVRRYLM